MTTLPSFRTRRRSCRRASLTAAVLAGVSTLSAVPLGSESFENPNGTPEAYTGNPYLGSFFVDGTADYFSLRNITADNTPLQWGGTGLVPISGQDGNWAIVCEDVNDAGNPLATFSVIRLGNFNVTDHNNLQVTVRLGSFVGVNSSWENNKSIRIEYAFDNPDPIGGPVAGLSSSGYSVAGAFFGSNILGQGATFDSNGNGQFDSGEEASRINANGVMNDWTFSIPGGGNNLSIQIVVDNTGGSEELAIDYIRVTGDFAATAPPALAGIEAGTVPFTEGGLALQITNSLTVTDTDSNIASATARIQFNNQPGEDVLSIVGTLPDGITAEPYDPLSGTLSFTGSASPADYQAALRQVVYSNTSTNPNTFLPRTVRFEVTDGSNTSNSQDRGVIVTSVITEPLSIPHTETFDTDGDGGRYTSNSFTDGQATPADYFERTDSNPHPGQQGGVYTFSPPQGGGYLAAEDVGSSPNPLGPTAPGIVRLPSLDSSGLGNLQATIHLADLDNGTTFDGGEKIEVQVAFDAAMGGVNLLGGTYTTVGRFVADAGGALRQDTNLDGVSTDPADAASPTLTPTFTPYTFEITGSGELLSVQVVVTNTSGSEEIAFDHLVVDGQVVGDPPVLAGIEAGALGVTEGDPAALLTGTITATDGDSANLESATVQVTTGYIEGEDVLAVSGALPAGITEVGFDPADGSITLTGSAPIAAYQTALGQITYENTGSPNPNVGDRTVTFQVNDGTSNSNIMARMVTVAGVVSPGTIPYLEAFGTDGDGDRYTSNSFTDGQVTPQDFFERTDLNPHPGHTLIGPFIFTAPQSGGYWVAEDIENADNKLGTHGIVRLPNLDATAKKDFQVSLYLAEHSAKLDPGDQIEIQAAFDANGGGTSLTSGNYTTIGRFIASGTDTALRQDSDLDGTSSDPEDAASPDLTATMTPYTFDVPGTGSVLSVQIKITQNGGSEEIAFDHIEVTGTPFVPPVADLTAPADAGSITAHALNTQGSIDVTFTDTDGSLDPTSITDAGAEFRLSGTGVGSATVDGAAQLQGGTTYRYTFSGSFQPGTVTVDFLASAFRDDEGNPNVAETEGFTVENSPPTLAADTVERYPTQSIKIPVAGLLSNDSDPEMNGPLTVTGVTSTGGNGASVTLSGGFVLYAPNGHTGPDSFTYTAEDSLGASSPGTVSVTIITDISGTTSITIADVDVGAGAASLTVAGIPGRSYEIQGMDSTDPGNWFTLDTLVAPANGQIQFNDPGPLPGTRLYRILQSQP